MRYRRARKQDNEEEDGKRQRRTRDIQAKTKIKRSDGTKEEKQLLESPTHTW